MTLRIHLFLLNSKAYLKLALLREKQPAGADATGDLISLMARAVFEAVRA